MDIYNVRKMLQFYYSFSSSNEFYNVLKPVWMAATKNALDRNCVCLKLNFKFFANLKEAKSFRFLADLSEGYITCVCACK